MKAVLFASLSLVGYTFVGYPLLMAILARLRPNPVLSDPDYEPHVSFIIVAYNEADVIQEKLRNTDDLDYPQDQLEVLVVADGSDDETASLAREVPGTVVLHEPERRGKLAAMHRAVAAASADILVFSDANNLYSPESIRLLVAPFADPRVGVVTGRKAIDESGSRPLDTTEGLYWRYESRVKEWETSVGSVAGVAGEIIAFRRESFYPAPHGIINDDFVQAMLAARHGWRIVYVPEALSLERASATLEDEALRRSRVVAGRLQALRELIPELLRANPWFALQVVSHKGLRPLVPWALMAGYVSNVFVARRQAWGRWLLALQGSLYCAALAGWANARRGRRNPKPLYLPYYFCRMNLSSLKGIRDFFARRHTAAWVKVRRG